MTSPLPILPLPMMVPEALPILTTQGLVIFPETISHMLIGHRHSIKLVEDAMGANRMLGLIAEPGEEGAKALGLPRVGTAAFVHEMFRSPDGSARLLVQGIRRFKIREFLHQDPYLVARVDDAPEVETTGLEVELLARQARDEYLLLLSLTAGSPNELSESVAGVTSPRELVYLAASTSPLPIAHKQELLELDSVTGKLRRLVELLHREVAVRTLEQDIHTKTQEKLAREQREYVLREQLKTIHEQLGEDDADRSEARQLEAQLAAADLPGPLQAEVHRELRRLETIPSSSPERAIVRTYIDWMVSLPWQKRREQAIDIAEARRVLDRDHYALEAIKTRIVEHLAVTRLRAERGRAAAALGHEPILCLVGPPGVGKTSLGESIARAMGRRFARISLGGLHDEAEIRGHRRTYVGAMPGRIVQALRRADAADPVFLLDEIDKIGVGFQGDPAAALLELLDSAQNHAFVDSYLGVPFDLSHVMFVCTANTIDTLAPALLDRLEVLTLSGYTEQDKIQVAERYLLPMLVQEIGLAAGEVLLEQDTVRAVIRGYTREAGVRGLGRQLAHLLRRAVLAIAEGDRVPLVLDGEKVRAYLGRPRFSGDEAAQERTDRPGVAAGLAFTPGGGEVLFIEAAIMKSPDEKLILTGMLGEVMRESAQAALSYLRSDGAASGVDPRAFEQKSIHLHVPMGGVPKDGPSAGATMLVALASLAQGRPVRRDLAVTGEVTLRGRILGVGGVREKVLAAERAGFSTIVLPRVNACDLDEIPQEIRNTLRFVLVDSADEVLAASLTGDRQGNEGSACRGPSMSRDFGP